MTRKIGGVGVQSAPPPGLKAGGPVSPAHGDFIYNGGAVIT